MHGLFQDVYMFLYIPTTVVRTKGEVEEITKDWPSGSYLVLECKDLELFYVGYNYSYKQNAVSVISNFYSAHHINSLTFPVQFGHLLELGTLGLPFLGSPILPNGPTSSAASSNVKSFGLILLASTFSNLI